MPPSQPITAEVPPSRRETRRLPRTLLTAGKILVALGILTYLFVQANDSFSQLRQERIVWGFVAGALVCTFGAAAISFVRWHLLVRSVGIEIHLLQTMRLGALGMALNFVSPGLIGGDLFKAIFLAHGKPGQRTEAVATVVADRMTGLLTMLVIASIGILATDLLTAPSAPLRILCGLILLTTVVSWSIVATLLLVPGLTGPRVSQSIAHWPIVGRTGARLLGAAAAYRSRQPILVAVFGLSTISAVLFITSFYLVARALPHGEPPWSEHLVVVPVAGLVGAIPITPSGLGTMELAFEELYRHVPGGADVERGDGTLVALGRRATEICVAAVGLVFYFAQRRKVDEVFAEAESANLP